MSDPAYRQTGWKVALHNNIPVHPNPNGNYINSFPFQFKFIRLIVCKNKSFYAFYSSLILLFHAMILFFDVLNQLTFKKRGIS